ncbi:DNA repair protein RecN [Bartonella bacilliformis str. Heidi Mejia]|uniref:DNA repair protein RecN n=2 Tax=Bartonella bacilliformis TaxID=774 RepID=A1UTB6_BARBK|nr:DNA repair protein RecN [Bartonella bacilliformis]ABM45383.1 DNA repair protein RecN [Bartonella bacilliformis KC583]AMG85990.1 DNA repair protein RecN [Bartonella bacilliformis]EKS43479.1 DNA repair protein RecN [Bartonella bacilliformis INS]EYS89693.1 DNA repair protein RecN [Bartonella bacilliformis San Pedro600-02]EYS92632.1 DNA repair protein RecN [Bartonella bacilliformis str. Heidi Mejia]
MLVQLSIHDIVLIEKLDVNFSAGLSILTGETGAGKSILLDSLSLSLGGRGDASLVRHGAVQGQVIAVFDVPISHPVRQLIRENGFDDEGDIILRRVQSNDGRSRAFINDQVVSISLMRNVGRMLVEIHGQHDDRALVDANTYRQLLDSFGQLDGDVSNLRKCYQIWRELEQRVQQQRVKVENAAREADYLRASVEELDKLEFKIGEEEELSLRRSDMLKLEKIATDIKEANDLFNGQKSPIPVLSNLMRRLERKIDESQALIEPIVKSIDDALCALEIAQEGIETTMQALDFDISELERIEERLFALRGLARKYHISVDELAQLRDKMNTDLADFDTAQITLEHLEVEMQEAQKNYDTLAQALSVKRKEVARRLSESVMIELPALKLEKAEFIVKIQSDAEKRSADGIDRVEYWVQTNPGTRAGPMLNVASGGELSRFLLALKVVLVDCGSAPTLIFDEIDTGVGGAVAAAIGQRLLRLSKDVQVFAVTHAPQVASKAHNHFLISKIEESDGRHFVTDIRKLEKHERAEEIARMLAGEQITEEARAAAQKLLAQI